MFDFFKGIVDINFIDYLQKIGEHYAKLKKCDITDITITIVNMRNPENGKLNTFPIVYCKSKQIKVLSNEEIKKIIL